MDLTERACSEHISDQVNLKWTLTGTETSGVTSLRGISLSATMLGLITVAPLQWGEYINSVVKKNTNILTIVDKFLIEILNSSNS